MYFLRAMKSSMKLYSFLYKGDNSNFPMKRLSECFDVEIIGDNEFFETLIQSYRKGVMYRYNEPRI